VFCVCVCVCVCVHAHAYVLACVLCEHILDFGISTSNHASISEMDAFFCFHAPEDAIRYSLVADEKVSLNYVLVCERTQRV